MTEVAEAGEETVIGRRFKTTVAGRKTLRERVTEKIGPDSVPTEDTLIHTALDDIGQPVEDPEHLVKTDCCGKMVRGDTVQACPSCHSLHICSRHMTTWHVCRACYWRLLARKVGLWIGWGVKWLVIIAMAIIVGIIMGIFSGPKKPPQEEGGRA